MSGGVTIWYYRLDNGSVTELDEMMLRVEEEYRADKRMINYCLSGN